MKKTAALKVGILTILSICILILGIMWLKGRSISIGEKIEVHFKDIDGMRPGSAVQMMGMRIGQVDEILPVVDGENSYIAVRFVISEPGVEIPGASRISIQQSGIIGEKFLEITPPFPETVYIPLEKDFSGIVKEGDEVKLLFGEKYAKIGEIKEAKILDTKSLCYEERRSIKTPRVYKIKYIINVPDVEIPLNSSVKLVGTGTSDSFQLRFTPPEGVIVRMPEGNSKYTVAETIRLKEFLDIQLEAALALKETNDKINELLTNEFIDDIRLTLENTRDLSEKAGIIVDQVAVIVDSSRDDIKMLISSATRLSENMIVLSESANELLTDSGFKENLITTAESIKDMSREISVLIEDSKVQESLLNINSTTNDVSEIARYVNDLTKDKEFSRNVETTVVNLNDMMIKLSAIAESIDELTVEEKDKIKEIIHNSADASRDIKKFSDKLNQRFLLLRLLF